MSTVHVHERRDAKDGKRFSMMTIAIAVLIAIAAISFIAWSMLYNEPTVQTLDEVTPMSPTMSPPLRTP